MRQLALELSSPPAPTLDNFVVGENAEVMTALRNLGSATNGERMIYLWGAAGSGRSHLLRAALADFSARGCSTGLAIAGEIAGDIPEVDAVAQVFGVDDVERLREESQIRLFNIINEFRDTSGILLVTGDRPPARLPLRADLQTRLAWGLVYEVHALSEADRCAAVTAYAAARGFALPGEVLAYLLARAPRDLGALRALVDTLDRVSLEQKRAVTVPLAREVLQALQTQHGKADS